jgi:hypothetical protein
VAAGRVVIGLEVGKCPFKISGIPEAEQILQRGIARGELPRPSIVSWRLI